MKTGPQGKALEFHEFCPKVLKLNLSTGQRVIAKVAFGNYDPADLEGDERTLATEMFGGLERVSQKAKKFVVMRLGRGSGKTTLCAAYAIYLCVVMDLTRLGPGAAGYAMVVAPDRETAKLTIRMAREMIRSQPAIERLVTSDTKELIELRRPDGQTVNIESFAATRGGSAIRGRDIMCIILDEAEFMTSDDGDRNYAINDRDIWGAAKPRLLPEGKGMLISTPWPTETLMRELFEENFGKCLNAVAIEAPTLLVRGDDPAIVQMIEDELARDPENARRELFCKVDHLRGGEFFDVNSLTSSLVEYDFPEKHDPCFPLAVACDLGFKNDSSAIAVVQYDGQKYRLLFAEELRPKPGRPLKPSEVVRRFAEVTKLYGADGIVADSYYREALHEHLEKYGLCIYDAPEGTKGKSDVFTRTRAVLHEGKCVMPKDDLGKRLVQMAKMITSRPAPGGTITVKIPRKVGYGHCDLVSAWTLAVHKLAWSATKEAQVELQPGTDGWFQESQKRLSEHYAKQQKDYLKVTEREVKTRMSRYQVRKVLGLR